MWIEVMDEVKITEFEVTVAWRTTDGLEGADDVVVSGDESKLEDDDKVLEATMREARIAIAETERQGRKEVEVIRLGQGKIQTRKVLQHERSQFPPELVKNVQATLRDLSLYDIEKGLRESYDQVQHDCYHHYMVYEPNERRTQWMSGPEGKVEVYLKVEVMQN